MRRYTDTSRTEKDTRRNEICITRDNEGLRHVLVENPFRSPVRIQVDAVWCTKKSTFTSLSKNNCDMKSFKDIPITDT